MAERNQDSHVWAPALTLAQPEKINGLSLQGPQYIPRILSAAIAVMHAGFLDAAFGLQGWLKCEFRID